jgi:predicted kinase
MQLILIYGPPATGKLTVAEELSKIIGYGVFHNHLTWDIISPFVKFGSEEQYKINTKLRGDIIRELSRIGVKGMIFTFCYAPPVDNKFIKKLIGIIKKEKGEILFVHLYCNKSELQKRVKGESRKRFKKVMSKKELNYSLKKWDFFKSIPFVESYRIDNTEISPKKVALMIKGHYKLK